MNLGGGSTGFRADGEASDREIGGAVGMYVAFSPKPVWSVGLDGRVWTSSVGGVSWTFYGVGPVVSVYPGA